MEDILSVGLGAELLLGYCNLRGVSCQGFPFKITFRAQCRSEISPTNALFSTTGRAPAFFLSH
jgi:hypothetical protein